MDQNDRLLSAALAAVALLAQTACSNDEPVHCHVIDPRTHAVRIVDVQPGGSCPPASTIHTAAHPASGGFAGWYYRGGTAYYGPLPRNGRPATQQQADALERMQESDEAQVARENAARAARGGFGESGARGGFGG